MEDFESFLKCLVMQKKVNDREPFKVSIEREKKGDREVICTIKGSEADIINGVSNIVRHIVDDNRIDNKILKDMILLVFEKAEEQK